MKLSEFNFNLPEELIASHPLDNRDDARMLVLHRKSGEIEHLTFKEILNFFNAEDLFIFNDTRVFPAKLMGNKEKTGARIDRIFIGLYPPFVSEPRVRIPASLYQNKQGDIVRVQQLGYTDGVLVQPFDTPSYPLSEISTAPFVEYDLDIQQDDREIEIRTLPTLHVYEGREARYALQLGDSEPIVCSIHAGDFTAEWRRNVLRGYASRSIPASQSGPQRLRIYLLDPGIVLQEILIF